MIRDDDPALKRIHNDIERNEHLLRQLQTDLMDYEQHRLMQLQKFRKQQDREEELFHQKMLREEKDFESRLERERAQIDEKIQEHQKIVRRLQDQHRQKRDELAREEERTLAQRAANDNDDDHRGLPLAA